MSKELVISTNRHETKVAILEDDQLVEIYFQRANEYSLAGSIHKGRVTRVLPGMQSAFVDLGLERDTFLYVSDFFEENEEYDKIVGTGDERNPRVRGERSERGERGERSERGERPPQQQASPVIAAAAQVLEVAAPVEAVVDGEAVAQQAGSEAGGDRQDRGDRRGRRPRRRRNRGRGFPDSKYATDGGQEPAAGETAEADLAGGEEEDDAPVLVEAAAPAPVTYSAPSGPKEPVFVLPGESLAKYRGEPVVEEKPVVAEKVEKPAPVEVPAPVAAVAVPEPVVAAPVPVTVAVVEPEPGPAPIVDAAVEPEPEPAVPFVHTHEDALVNSQPTPSELAAAAEEIADIRAEMALGIDSASEEDEDDEEELVAAGDAESGEGAEDALASEDGEGNTETEIASAIEEDGVEPARQPQSLTAVLRDRDNSARFQNRSGRRMRRRGRGGDRGADRGGDRGNREPREPREPREAAPVAEGAVAPAATAGAAPAPQARTITREKGPVPSITDLLKEGQEILVQIAKEPMGQKGARITSHIALPGRYCVYMPTVEHMGVSRKIASDEERLRLKRILQAHRVGVPGGYIIRTAGEGKTEEDIASDMAFLYNLWLDIRTKSERRPAPLLVHHDLDIVQRILRDQLTVDFKTIWLDNEEMYESVLSFVQRFQPLLVGRVKMYTRPTPIFDAFNVTTDLEKALRPKVWLKSGGYIVINQTEALVAIDINTGKYVGKSNRLEDTIVKTNIEAVKEIVRQIRLRDLGGIIVIDFIDMDERKNRQKVMQALEEAMRVDRAPYKILQFNDFGLVAITRKRVKQSLERTLCSPCPYCEGAGSVKSIDTVIGEILVEATKIAKAVDGKDVLLRVNPDVAKVLKSHSNKFLEEMEEILKRPVLIKSDPSIHHEKFDLA